MAVRTRENLVDFFRTLCARIARDAFFALLPVSWDAHRTSREIVKVGILHVVQVLAVPNAADHPFFLDHLLDLLRLLWWVEKLSFTQTLNDWCCRIVGRSQRLRNRNFWHHYFESCSGFEASRYFNLHHAFGRPYHELLPAFRTRRYCDLQPLVLSRSSLRRFKSILHLRGKSIEQEAMIADSGCTTDLRGKSVEQEAMIADSGWITEARKCKFSSTGFAQIISQRLQVL
jgi:hypothetical protein